MATHTARDSHLFPAVPGRCAAAGRSISVRALGLVGILVSFVAPAAAHGGRYVGGGVGPLPPAALGPATPAPAGPVAPGAASTLVAGSRDTSRWQVWWELEKDSFLQVKARVIATRDPTSQPTVAQIDREVVPLLCKSLVRDRQPDLLSACLVALGKVGPSGDAAEVRAAFRKALHDGVQETRETAALALGITRQAWALEELLALAADAGPGRRIVDRSRVDERTRAFAVYGLGLLAEHSDDLDLRARVIDLLVKQLGRARPQDLDLTLSEVYGLRLACPPASNRSLASWTLRQRVVDALWTYARRRARVTEQVVQAHALQSVARILAEDDSGVAAKFLDPLVAELREPSGSSAAKAQSAAIGLGYMARPEDEAVCAALRQLARKGTDRHARSFALIALGRIGGEANRGFLLKTLAEGHKVTVKPWAGLALGLMRFEERTRSGSQGSVDTTVERALRAALKDVKAAEARGAFALALGLAHATDAAPDLRALLDDNDRQDELAGYLALSLALLEDAESVPRLRDLAKRSLRRPQLLRQVATASGMLGDRGAAQQLLDLMRGNDLSVATLGAVAGALGQIGDGGALASLLVILRDDGVPDLARAFAAAAVGGILDASPLPWNASLATGVNFVSTLPSLTDGLGGVLDIL
ncbi:MAG: hypothetical protein R3F56_06325 [Planctomycetota bacterium]